jgi:hypothetical protein
VDVISATPTAALVKCFRCTGDECPKCGGPSYRERKRCEKCGEPSGRLSEGLRPLVGTKERSRRRAILPRWLSPQPRTCRFGGVGPNG